MTYLTVRWKPPQHKVLHYNVGMLGHNRLTVVIPTFNRLDLLQQSIKFLEDQTIKGFNVVECCYTTLNHQVGGSSPSQPTNILKSA